MTEELKQKLDQLQKSLDDTDNLDQATLESIEQAISQLQQVVQDSQPINEIEQTLETLVLDFDHKHPVIAEAIRDTINLLGRMGI